MDYNDWDRDDLIKELGKHDAQLSAPAVAEERGLSWGERGAVSEARRALIYLAEHERPAHKDIFPSAEWCIEIAEELDDLLVQHPAAPAPEAKEGWTGRPCPRCHGTGIDDPIADIAPCSACGGTGEEYASKPPRTALAPTAEKALREAYQQGLANMSANWPAAKEVFAEAIIKAGRDEWFRDTTTITWSRVERAMRALLAHEAPAVDA